MALANGSSDYKGQVLAATDIVELIGQSVALKRRGRTFTGLCPFHQEKTPSFHVNPAKQYFHCFGCKAGGNAIDFVIKRDRVEFLEALKILGQRAGIEMPKYGVSKQKTGEREVLLSAQSAACSLFEKLLSHPEQGAAARQYLEKRGIDRESIKRFQIGVAADSWDTLLSVLSKKFQPVQLQQAGLVKARERGGSGFYDTFRNRLMFPIRDESSRVIAFGGRVMPGSEDPAKYLNSPETPLFSKSKCIYGLDLARQRMIETRTVCIVEGYTDVVMAHQFGVSNVVSILGTALTDDHLKILKRFAEKVVFLFDPDVAGAAALERSIELGLVHNMQIGVASLPGDADPDEFLLEYGTEAFQSLIDKADDVLKFAWQNITKRHTKDGQLKRDEAVKEYIRPFDRARAYGAIDVIRWGAIVHQASKQVEMLPAELNRYFSMSKTLAKEAVQETSVSEPTEKVPVKRVAKGPPDANKTAENRLLGVLLAEPQRWHDVQQVVHLEDFTDEQRKKLAEIYWDQQRHDGEPVFSEFLTQLPESTLTELAIEAVEEVEALGDLDRILNQSLEHLAWVKQRREEQKLMSDLRRNTGVDSNPGDDVDMLKKLAERAKKPDLRRS